jgi:hypothetical protein
MKKTETKKLKDVYTGNIYCDDEVLALAPAAEHEGVLEFFTLDKYVDDDEVQKEYESRGLVPADMISLGEWCEKNQTKNNTYYVTHWKDKDDKWCYAAFCRWHDDYRSVVVFRH